MLRNEILQFLFCHFIHSILNFTIAILFEPNKALNVYVLKQAFQRNVAFLFIFKCYTYFLASLCHFAMKLICLLWNGYHSLIGQSSADLGSSFISPKETEHSAELW